MNLLRALYISALFMAPVSGLIAQNTSSDYFIHTVTPGQTLYSIASMYNVSVDDIVDLNPGSEIILRNNYSLRIPQKKNKTAKQVFHTIQHGETLYKITKMYGVAANRICAANPGLSADNFKVGQVIVIPAEAESHPQLHSSSIAGKTAAKKESTKVREIYKVGRKETVSSISQKYGITEKMLIEANPELKENKLKKGQFLRIPYPKPANVSTPTNKELFSKSRSASDRYSKVKVAIVLPFMTNGGSKDEQSKMVEYYEGFLMAVDSLKRQGYSYDVYAFDSGDSESSLKSILAKDEMKSMNLIIGPAYYGQVKLASSFAKKNNIRLVVPFTSKGNDVYANPEIFQVNTPQSYLYSEVYNHFFRMFPDANVIFLENLDSNKDKNEFIKGFKNELTNRNKTYSEIKSELTDETINNTIAPNKNNIFIPISGTNMALLKIMPQLLAAVKQNPDYRIKLFGYPEWQTYTSDHLNNFYELDTYFYSSFYSNNIFSETNKFATSFRKNYGKILANTYPKYGMLGFDTGYYFLKALSLYGSSADSNLKNVKVTPVQTGFKFERVNNWGGFINKKIFFVHFNKNYELEKINFE